MGSYGDNFVPEFFRRTLYNLEKYDELHEKDRYTYPNNVTHLVNSFLGLIIFVNEDEIDLGDEIYNAFNEKIIRWSEGYDREKNSKSLIRHIRNAISHKRINEHIDKGGIIGFTFRDQRGNNRFEIKLSVEELRKLIILLNDRIS